MSESPFALLELPGIRAVCVGKELDGRAFDARDKSCLERLAKELRLSAPPRQAVQIHADDIDLDGTLEACDAFLVRPGQSALIRHADCFPVVVACSDPPLAIVAHCGWKGVATELAAKSVRQLLSMGCQAQNLSAAIGPGIQAASFEVGPEVLERFSPMFHSTTSWGTASVDLPAALVAQLTDSGIAPERIANTSIDTFVDPKFHSHRRERELSGRNVALCIVHSTSPQNQETQP